MYLYSLPDPPGQEAGLDLAVAETGQHPAIPAGLPLQDRLLLPEVQLLQDAPPACRHSGIGNNACHRITNQGLRLMLGLAAGHQRHPPGLEPVAAAVRLRYRQVVGVQVHADGARAFGP